MTDRNEIAWTGRYSGIAHPLLDRYPCQCRNNWHQIFRMMPWSTFLKTGKIIRTTYQTNQSINFVLLPVDHVPYAISNAFIGPVACAGCPAYRPWLRLVRVVF